MKYIINNMNTKTVNAKKRNARKRRDFCVKTSWKVSFFADIRYPIEGRPLAAPADGWRCTVSLIYGRHRSCRHENCARIVAKTKVRVVIVPVYVPSLLRSVLRRRWAKKRRKKHRKQKAARARSIDPAIRCYCWRDTRRRWQDDSDG